MVIVTASNIQAAIDCGFDDKAAAVTEALAQRGWNTDQVQAVFITHQHADHVGGCAMFPKATTFHGPNERAVDIGALHVVTFAVPGHTPESVAYLVDGTLFLGDAAQSTPSGIAASKYIFMGENRVPDTGKKNAEPLKALHARLLSQRLEVKRLMFGHSEPSDDVDALAEPE